MIEGIEKGSPFNRLGEPQDRANVVAFQAGKDSVWVAGQVIHIGTNGAAFVQELHSVFSVVIVIGGVGVEQYCR